MACMFNSCPSNRRFAHKSLEGSCGSIVVILGKTTQIQSLEGSGWGEYTHSGYTRQVLKLDCQVLPPKNTPMLPLKSQERSALIVQFLLIKHEEN